MRRIAIMALAGLLLLAAAAPALAGSYAKVRHRAHVLHTKVERQVSERAAGRDITTQGYRSKSGKVTVATGAQLRGFIDTLNRTLHPPAPPVVAAPPATTSASYAAPATGGGGGGTYCGAYQFDVQTWQSVGGSGSACGASPAEQDRRAQILLGQRGTSPWPNCGSTNLAAIRQCENGGSYR